MLKGERVANDPRNASARVHGMLMTALDGEDPELIGWMPSHLTKKDLQHGGARKSDGSLVTVQDVETNEWADVVAKKGAEQHRVVASDVTLWKEKMQQVKRRAKWTGVVTRNANSATQFPFSDSESARWRADANQ